MAQYFSSTQADSRHLHRSFILAISFAALLWVIKLIEFGFDLNLIPYGILPRTPSGLIGIGFAPLIHSSLSHLISNTGAIIILGTALLYGYPRSAKIALPVIYIVSGLGVWLFARSSYHIGASGLTFGMMFFVFTIGALRWDKRAIVLSMTIFLLYGSMIWGIFPTKPGISFESHFFGAATGVVLAFLLRYRDPMPPQKKYSWEYEQDDWGSKDDSL